MTIETPEHHETDDLIVASIHIKVAQEKMQEVFAPAVHELIDAIAGQGIEMAGPIFDHYHEITDQYFDFDLCVPVSAPVEPEGRIKPSTLPAAKVIKTVYGGPYEGLPGAWEEFDSWLDEQDISYRTDAVQRYLVGPEEPDPANWRTELVRFVEE